MSTAPHLRAARPRVLHLPNEAVDDRTHEQVGPRRAMQAMADGGDIAAYEVYSYLRRRTAVGDAWQRELLEVAAAAAPDLIVWQHVGHVPVDPALLQQLKALPSAPRLVYHEGDPHGRLLKRVPAPTRTLFAAADMALVVGGGHFAQVARRAGCPRVRVVVQPYDAERFGAPWTPTPTRELDAVMIGNLGGTRVPGLLLPGGRRRRRFATEVCRALGPDRFALYGSGWGDIPCARGRAPYVTQVEVIRRAWLSVNWDHFDREPSYASDRLAISLAAGVPHLTTRHEGYDAQYPGCEGLLLADTVAEAVALTREVLARGPEELIHLGLRARAYAEAHLEATPVWRGWLDMAARELLADRAGQV